MLPKWRFKTKKKWPERGEAVPFQGNWKQIHLTTSWIWLGFHLGVCLVFNVKKSWGNIALCKPTKDIKNNTRVICKCSLSSCYHLFYTFQGSLFCTSHLPAQMVSWFNPSWQPVTTLTLLVGWGTELGVKVRKLMGWETDNLIGKSKATRGSQAKQGIFHHFSSTVKLLFRINELLYMNF